MSFILISLFNTRFRSHLISFHFFFFKKIKNNKILCNFTCDLLSLWISDLKCKPRLLMLEDYDIVHFTIPWDGYKNEVQDLEPLIVSYRICIPLFDLYTTANDKSWCEVRNALKAVYIQNLTLSDQYLTIKFQRKSYDF